MTIEKGKIKINETGDDITISQKMKGLTKEQLADVVKNAHWCAKTDPYQELIINKKEHMDKHHTADMQDALAYAFFINHEINAKAQELDQEQAQQFPQDSELNEYRFLSPEWLDEIATGLTAGATKHPGETWHKIPTAEHLARAFRHINLYQMGDRGDKHLINASMRLMMAFETSKE